MQIYMSGNEKRLQFLLNIMVANNISKYELARIMGTSPQNIFKYLQRDDMKLSYAQKIMSELGYELRVRLYKEGDKSRKVMHDLEKLYGKDGVHRIAFLAVALYENGISKRDVAQRLGLNPSGVFRWFSVDDIAISHIYAIAEAYGFEFIFEGEKISKNG